MLSNKEIDKLIWELHDIAKDRDKYDYGLPIYSADYMEKMRVAVRNFLSNPEQDIDKIIEARKKQFEELKK